MFCNQCGAQLKEGLKYCTACGAELEEQISQAAAGAGAAPRRQPSLQPSQAIAVTEAVTSAQTTDRSVPPEDLRSSTVGHQSKSSGISPVAFWGGMVLLIVAVAVTALILHRRPPLPRPVSDVEIVETLEAKFAADPNLSTCAITPHSEKGVVTLVGNVNSEADKSAATAMAAQVAGVKQVNIFELAVRQPVVPGTGSTDGGSDGSPQSSQIAEGSRSITVPANQGWTATGISLRTGDVVTISATGSASMGAGWPPMPPAGRSPDCGGRQGFPAAQLPCWSLIGRVGEQGVIFPVGSGTALRVPKDGELFFGVNDDIIGDNSGSWTATVVVNGAKSSVVQASNGDIRAVDLRNFGYLSAYCGTKDSAGHMRPIHLSGGTWKTGTPFQDEATFRIVNITYGDVTGDGRTEAVVHTSCAGIANFDDQELYVLAMNAGEPVLLARLTPNDWGKGQEDNGSDYAISKIEAGAGHLDVSFYSGGSHACADWIVTTRFQWNGSRLLGVPLSRSKNSCDSAATNPVPAEHVQALWLGFANETSPQDREAQLRRNCGNFTRTYVPPNAGNTFTDLCGYVGKRCQRICDWQGSNFECSAVSLGGARDGSRVALCR